MRFQTPELIYSTKNKKRDRYREKTVSEISNRFKLPYYPPPPPPSPLHHSRQTKFFDLLGFIYGVALLLLLAAWGRVASGADSGSPRPLAAAFWIICVAILIGLATVLGARRPLRPPMSESCEGGEATDARAAVACTPLDARTCRATMPKCVSLPVLFSPQPWTETGAPALTGAPGPGAAAAPIPAGRPMWRRRSELLLSEASRVIASGQAATHRRRRIAATLSLLNVRDAAGPEGPALAWSQALSSEPGSGASSVPSSPGLAPMTDPRCNSGCPPGLARSRSSPGLEASPAGRSSCESRSSLGLDGLELGPCALPANALPCPRVIKGSSHVNHVAKTTSGCASICGYGSPVQSGGLWQAYAAARQDCRCESFQFDLQ